MPSDPLLQWRSEFPILDRTVYMISHSLGAMPRRTRARLNQYADEWDTRGIRAWEEGWWEMPVTVGDLIAKIIGAGAGGEAGVAVEQERGIVALDRRRYRLDPVDQAALVRR